MLIRLRVFGLMVVTVFAISACTVDENTPPEGGANSAVLNQVTEGPKDPPDCWLVEAYCFLLSFIGYLGAVAHSRCAANQ